MGQGRRDFEYACAAEMEDRMKKLLLAGTALAALAAGSANAADLSRPVPVYRAPPPVVTLSVLVGLLVGT